MFALVGPAIAATPLKYPYGLPVLTSQTAPSPSTAPSLLRIDVFLKADSNNLPLGAGSFPKVFFGFGKVFFRFCYGFCWVFFLVADGAVRVFLGFLLGFLLGFFPPPARKHKTPNKDSNTKTITVIKFQRYVQSFAHFDIGLDVQ